MTPHGTDQLGPLPVFLQDGTAEVTPIIAPTGDQLWLVRDYALGRVVLADPRFSRSAAVRADVPRLTDTETAPDSMMSMDGSGHARLRRLVVGAFTARRIADMAPRIQQLVDAGLDRIAGSGAPADLISELAAPLSLAVLGQLLGIPPDDNEKFRDWVEVLFDISASSPQQKARRRLELVDYMAGLVGAKRARPGDDLITALIGRHEEGDLTAAEMLTLGLTLLMAGYETTIGQIGLTVMALLRDPATHRALREQPGLLPGAVEEFLRLSPSTPLSFPRVTLERVQLGTVTLGPGASVIVSLLHGNRDAKIFAEPARLCPEGRGPGHLTFGHGMHRCVGAPLARLEVEIVVARLLQRFPGLRLADDPGAVVWKDGLATRGLSRLSVAW